SDKSFVLSGIALAQARASKFADAVRTASEIRDTGERDQNFRWIAFQQADAGDAQGATQLAHTIKNARYRAETLADIASLRAEAGHPEEARIRLQEALATAQQALPDESAEGRSSLLACAPEAGTSSSDPAMESIVVAQAVTGDPTGALETIGRMNDKTARDGLIERVAEYQAHAGDFAGAKSSISAISSDSCKTAALHGVAMAHFEAGNLSAALSTVSEMTNPEQKASTLTYLAGQVVKQGTFNSAVELLARARVIAAQITSKQERAPILLQIAHIQVQAGSRDEARKTLAQAVPDALAADEEDRNNHAWSSTLGSLIERQLEIGDLDGAFVALARIDDRSRPYVVWNTAQEQSKTGDTQGALAWAARQASPLDKAFALVGVAQGILDRLEPPNRQAGR
ncbi:MAG: hypothetical protein LAN71_14575, partial [Acidobacteriia bacterium]|nr:hypothetical protein [Terriglobia bacterium]